MVVDLMAVSRNGLRNIHSRRLQNLCPVFQARCHAKTADYKLYSIRNTVTVHKRNLHIMDDLAGMVDMSQ
jgi:hypothetical protein